MMRAVLPSGQALQLANETAVSTSEPDKKTAHAISEFSSSMAVYAAALENAYLHARNTHGLTHGTYRRWQCPAESDEEWNTLVVRWARNTLIGPWCASKVGAAAMCLMLAELLADSVMATTVELRLINGPDYELVVAVVADRPEEDDGERVRLVGDFITGGADALVRDYMPLALAW